MNVPVIVLSSLGLAWIYTRIRRILPQTQEEILNRIHKGEFDKLKNFVPNNASSDVLKMDQHFWECMGGFRGLQRKRENAVCCVQLCQRYALDSGMDTSEDYVSRRSFAIAFLVHASIAEQAVRLIWWKMPHFCARWVAYLYWESVTQVQMLHLEYGSGTLSL